MKSAYLAAASAAAIIFASDPTRAETPAATSAVASPRHFGAHGLDLTAGDRRVKPGDSFFDYANGAWYAKAQIPADQPVVGSGIDLYNLTQEQLREVIEDSARSGQTPVAAKIGGLYSSFMDEARVEKLDAAPLQPDLARIRAVKTKAEMAELMGRTQHSYGSGVFTAGVVPDAKHPERNSFTLLQSGLGLPDRDYYLADSFKAQKAAYLAYIARTLQMIGWADPAANAQAVLNFETRIAEASWARVDRRDPTKTYNPMSVAELKALAPDFDWAAYFRGAGTPGLDRVVVFERTAFPKLATVYAQTPMETLKAWEAFHTTDQAAAVLSKRFVDSKFEYSKVLSGQQALRARWKRGVALVDGSLGEAVGQEYVARHFPPQAKAKMEALIVNLKDAMRARIQHADWMSPATKSEALTKLARLRVKVGYPNKWRDYTALRVDPNDLYGNAERASEFEWNYGLAKLAKPVDHEEWLMTPQTVNAYNNPRSNEIVFPAAMLQAPMFDAQADMAVNYGAIGGVIGHEITHGYDDQGRQFDSTGALRDWWTAQDAARFTAEAAKLAAQYDAFEPVPGMHINGKQTLGENIADMGGLLLGLDAYHASLHGRPAPVIDGLTGDQRVFMGWAQAWRNKVREDTARMQMAADVHSPPKFRVDGPTRNIDAWYAAFDVKPGEKNYLPPQQRARVW